MRAVTSLAAAQNPIRFCAPIVATATGDAAHDVPRLSPEREPLCETTVREQLLHNIHIRDEVAEDEFVRLRQTRDASLAMPTLMLPAIQVNIRAGMLPAAEKNGIRYLRIPLNVF